jgi:hypothetical protein
VGDCLQYCERVFSSVFSIKIGLLFIFLWMIGELAFVYSDQSTILNVV